MRLSKHKPPGSLAFNITPMIDIVFLLIIFFMTVSQITRTVDTPLPLPRVGAGDSKSVTASVTINLNQNGSLLVGGEKIALPAVISLLESRLQKANSNPDKIKIQIRVHRACQSKHVTKLLTGLSKLGFTNIRSAVTDE